MTCIHISVHPQPTRSASSAPEPEPAKWLHSGLPPGPRSPRTLWRSTDQSGPVISTEASWMNVGGLDTTTQRELHKAHLLARRKALVGTLAKLRREHRAVCSVTEDLRGVTHELLAMGDR